MDLCAASKGHPVNALKAATRAGCGILRFMRASGFFDSDETNKLWQSMTTLNWHDNVPVIITLCPCQSRSMAEFSAPPHRLWRGCGQHRSQEACKLVRVNGLGQDCHSAEGKQLVSVDGAGVASHHDHSWQAGIDESGRRLRQADSGFHLPPRGSAAGLGQRSTALWTMPTS